MWFAAVTALVVRDRRVGAHGSVCAMAFLIQVAVLEFGRVASSDPGRWSPAQRSGNRRACEVRMRSSYCRESRAHRAHVAGDHSDRSRGGRRGAPMLGLYDGAKRWDVEFLECTILVEVDWRA